MESAAIGLMAARFAAAEALGQQPSLPPPTTAHGALLAHVTGRLRPRRRCARDFQPMNVNFGLFPPLGEAVVERGRQAAARQGQDAGAGSARSRAARCAISRPGSARRSASPPDHAFAPHASAESRDADAQDRLEVRQARRALQDFRVELLASGRAAARPLRAAGRPAERAAAGARSRPRRPGDGAAPESASAATTLCRPSARCVAKTSRRVEPFHRQAGRPAGSSARAPGPAANAASRRARP